MLCLHSIKLERYSNPLQAKTKPLTAPHPEDCKAGPLLLISKLHSWMPLSDFPRWSALEIAVNCRLSYHPVWFELSILIFLFFAAFRSQAMTCKINLKAKHCPLASPLKNGQNKKVKIQERTKSAAACKVTWSPHSPDLA